MLTSVHDKNFLVQIPIWIWIRNQIQSAVACTTAHLSNNFINICPLLLMESCSLPERKITDNWEIWGIFILAFNFLC